MLSHATLSDKVSGTNKTCSHGGALATEPALQVMTAKVHSNLLHVGWRDGFQATFHACWLRDNCPCDRCQTSSGQKNAKTIVPGEKSQGILHASITPNGQVMVLWNDKHFEHKSLYSCEWLRKYSYSDEIIESEQTSRTALHMYRNKTTKRIPEAPYESLSAEEGVWEWMKKINDHGLCVIRKTPIAPGVVKEVANLIGPVSHTVYGETFDVVATPKPINIAYSDTALEPHMDLAYFESPPGIQMLHCIKFDEGVKGGDSTIIDAHAVAEELQTRDPESFKILTRVPATFQKDHVERAHPLKMFYQRPHILTNYEGNVTSVFWSPPFEGPLRVKPSDVEPYYRAYASFKKLLMSQEMWDKYGFCFRLQPGDMVTFNNRRMLHGRNAFTSEDGNRHLQGCYLDIDTVLNKFRILSAMHQPKTQAMGILGAPSETRCGTSSHR
mmetsp:Transcript_4640/g.6952  ORF Transcript_4640/g.6952 Transcript_4640/m.6952 type:complete len:441 (+) Transcript_4640:1155-2477(+)|eukprot:CAMPEP_0203766418 /NCGR_PEP_ID=MMETSP0099_2-20121227/407_1 /ASSEMBLY_ACC=CAM_ASM_000209 /TAXON_ID=96639 /ORGANISM=" , Strain NY0313808BC1" /LENGTH=440 /DNA_ID=CAMNT_0050662767 /DNA_START=692 /DNA_END=2014 /DNA_ORIENTATION=-